MKSYGTHRLICLIAWIIGHGDIMRYNLDKVLSVVLWGKCVIDGAGFVDLHAQAMSSVVFFDCLVIKV